MDMLSGCLHSDRTTSWNALSTSREHKYPSPSSLRADTLLFHNQTLRLCQSPLLPLPDCKNQQSSQVTQVLLAQALPKKHLSSGVSSPCVCLPLNQGETQRWWLSAPLCQGQHPPRAAPGVVNEEVWQERREPFLCRNLSCSLWVSLESGQNLARYGVITTACYFPLYLPYIKLEGIHRDPAVEESMQSLQ